MTIIGALAERCEEEARVAVTPDSAIQLQKLGYECVIETGAGKAAGFLDEAYRAASMTILDSGKALIA